MIDEQTILEVVTKFYLCNDPSHRIDHAIAVKVEALRINQDLGLKLNVGLVTAAALFHDIYANDQAGHNRHAYEYINSVDFPLKDEFTRAELYVVSKAVLEHRASWHGGYTTLLSALIATADRGEPIYSDLLERAKVYVKARLLPNANDETITTVAREHVRDKYGRHGYMAIPDLYIKAYGQALERLYHKLDT